MTSDVKRNFCLDTVNLRYFRAKNHAAHAGHGSGAAELGGRSPPKARGDRAWQLFEKIHSLAPGYVAVHRASTIAQSAGGAVSDAVTENLPGREAALR
jgi:hypothetical protein